MLVVSSPYVVFDNLAERCQLHTVDPTEQPNHLRFIFRPAYVAKIQRITHFIESGS